MANPLKEAFEKVRNMDKKSFFKDKSKVSLFPISLKEDIVFSYANDLLKDKSEKISYLFYQIVKIGDNDSFGVHFAIDFVKTIFEVTDTHIYVDTEAYFYITSPDSKTIIKKLPFSKLNDVKSKIGVQGGYEAIANSGGNHTKKAGFDLGGYSMTQLLN